MFILGIWIGLSSCLARVISMSCGIDNSPVEHVSEGVATIETYPWLGILYYTHYKKRYTTAVVLVTRQIVIATALEIDKLPKEDFRVRARVVIGHNCSVGPGVGIRDYAFHPDYSKNTFSTIALIQLETDLVTTELRPICPPPRAMPVLKQEIFAKVFSEDCNESKMTIHRMMFVSTEDCKTYYRRAELGFGVYGPGCQAPARFLDYGMYHEWVQRSIQRIGRPAITKVAPNYVVLRRTLSNVQRFGPCDEGEVRRELYTESTDIQRPYNPYRGLVSGKYHFNLTIIGDVEYSCIILRADYKARATNKTPKLHLTRYCANSGMTSMCFTGVQFIEIQFYVEITFDAELQYSVAAYGRTVRAIDPHRAHKYANKYSNRYPPLLTYDQYKLLFLPHVKNESYPLYGKKQMTSRAVSGPLTTTARTKTRIGTQQG